MTDYLNVQNSNFNFFGQKTLIKGILHITGISKISSHIEGELIIDDQSDLFLGPEGSISGDVKCHHFEISGKFTGKIHSTGKVTIYPQALVEGEIIAADLMIHPGAFVQIKGHTLSP